MKLRKNTESFGCDYLQYTIDSLEGEILLMLTKDVILMKELENPEQAT